MRVLIRNKISVTLMIFFFLGLPLLSMAQFSIEDKKVDNQVKSAFSALYNFQFNKAHDLMARNIEGDNSSAWYYFTASNIQLWEIFAGSSDGDIKKSYRVNLERQLQYCSELSNNKEALFLRIMHYAYLTRLTMDEKEYILAFRAVRNYYHLLKHTFQDTTYAPYLLIDGLYYYLFSYAWENYILLRPFLGLYRDGDASLGFRYLRKAANSPNKIISTEARYFLMKIWYDLEKKPGKALPYAWKLRQDYPGNFIFDFYYHKIRKALDSGYSPDLKKIKARIISTAELNAKQEMYFKNLLKNRYPA